MPKVLVVEEQHFHWQFFAVQCRQLLNVHLEATVAVDVDHQRIRIRGLNTHRCWQTESHRAQARRAEPMARLAEVEELSGPHLMLAHADSHEGIAILRHVRQLANRVLLQNAIEFFGRSGTDTFASVLCSA